MRILVRSKTYFGLVIASLLLAFAHGASAFCGFFVTGADAQLYANATMVVLMRDGTRTVLSMQNNYQGPPDQFALVIPVPVVLQQAQVKTLPNDVFARVDQLGAPRLVEYWEQDPCRSLLDYRGYPTAAGGGGTGGGSGNYDAGSGGVRVEAQFAVGEYDVVILSADDSSSLSTWLTENKYNIPQGAAPVLAPYVAAGMKFFVAKVDTSRVTFHGNQAALSPLRFYYDSNDFSLPVRLGLLNSQGAQDLIVNILSPNQRFEVANYANATIPTNIRVRNEVRDAFGSFYEGLFQRAIAGHPRTVVTEYSWDAQTCDPCPIPPLTANELATLGADVTRGGAADGGAFSAPYSNLGYTLTRLHYRYAPSDLGEDLVFSAAPTLQGGRGIPDQGGNLNSQITTRCRRQQFSRSLRDLAPLNRRAHLRASTAWLLGGAPFGLTTAIDRRTERRAPGNPTDPGAGRDAGRTRCHVAQPEGVTARRSSGGSGE